MKKYLVMAVALIFMTMTIAFAAGPNDPCQNPEVVKLSGVISVGSGTTTSVIARTANKSIYVCGISAVLSGTTTATTAQLKSGTTTTTACDTGATLRTGVYTTTGALGMPITASGSTIFKTGAGEVLCTTTTGTSSGLYGVITYVKQ